MGRSVGSGSVVLFLPPAVSSPRTALAGLSVGHPGPRPALTPAASPGFSALGREQSPRSSLCGGRAGQGGGEGSAAYPSALLSRVAAQGSPAAAGCWRRVPATRHTRGGAGPAAARRALVLLVRGPSVLNVFLVRSKDLTSFEVLKWSDFLPS